MKLVAEVFSYYCQDWQDSLVYVLKKFGNKHEIILFSRDISIAKFFSKVKMNLNGYCNTVSIKNRFYSIYRSGVVIFYQE